jgi:anti-sigma factor RsiW
MNHDENLCAEIQSTLPLYVGGDLEAQALAEVRLHLVDCPRCAERALSARSARRELVAALRLQARRGPDLWAGVRAALVEEGVLHAQPHVAVASPRPWWRSWGALAAAAAVVFGVWIGARWPGADPAVPRDEAQPVASEMNFNRAQAPITFVDLPAPDSLPPTDLAQVPSGESPHAREGGLRRLRPGERQLRDSVPLVPIDRAYLYGAPVLDGSGVQPVSLHRVGSNAPRW